MSTIPSGLRIAAQAALITVRDPLAVGLLVGVQLLLAAALWACATKTVGAALTGRPDLDLQTWAGLLLSSPGQARRLLIGTGIIGGIYFVTGTFLSGALLARIRDRTEARAGRALRAGLCQLGPLLCLRLGVLGLVGVLTAGAVVAVPWVFERSLRIVDERWQALLLIGAVLPIALALIVALLIGHYGQALLIRGCRLRSVVGQTLALIHRRGSGTAGLYLLGWALWAVPGLLQLAFSLPGWLAAPLRVGVHVFMYAAAVRVAQAWTESTSGDR